MSAEESGPAGRGSWLSAPFWEAAERGVLTRQVCARCDTNFFVPQICCPACQSEDWAYVPSSGRGHIETFSVVSRGPTPEVPTPYVVAIVRLDEGWSMMSNIVGERANHVAVGRRVRVAFEEKPGFGKTPVFEIEGEQR